MTPRQTVRNYWLAKLTTITRANGYRTDVLTVALRSGLVRDLNTSEYPAIIMTQQEDRPLMETLGANTGNNHFREWSLDLHIIAQAQNEQAVEDAGEDLIADVLHCLIVNRFSGGKPSDVRVDTISPQEFERIENRRAEITMRIVTKYDFTVQEL